MEHLTLEDITPERLASARHLHVASVFLQPALLPRTGALFRRAKEAGISRNRFILQALERAVEEQDSWDPAFFARLQRIGPDEAKAVDEMLVDIMASRRSKPPLEL
jgi:hypothetical protein